MIALTPAMLAPTRKICESNAARLLHPYLISSETPKPIGYLPSGWALSGLSPGLRISSCEAFLGYSTLSFTHIRADARQLWRPVAVSGVEPELMVKLFYRQLPEPLGHHSHSCRVTVGTRASSTVSGQCNTSYTQRDSNPRPQRP